MVDFQGFRVFRGVITPVVSFRVVIPNVFNRIIALAIADLLNIGRFCYEVVSIENVLADSCV